ncbi:MAG: hypothetical protein AAGC95_12885 [Pseudomonadota bacterium]
MIKYVAFSILACATVILVRPMNAFSGDLARERQRAAAETILAEEISYTNEVCGADIDSTIDWESFEEAGFDNGENVADACDAGLSAIEDICRSSKTGRDGVASEISSFSCAAGLNADADLSAGVFSYTAGNDGFDAARAYLAALFV